MQFLCLYEIHDWWYLNFQRPQCPTWILFIPSIWASITKWHNNLDNLSNGCNIITINIIIFCLYEKFVIQTENIEIMNLRWSRVAWGAPHTVFHYRTMEDFVERSKNHKIMSLSEKKGKKNRKKKRNQNQLLMSTLIIVIVGL